MSYSLKLDPCIRPPHNDLAAFNSAAEIGVSNYKADKPLPSGIFTSVNTIAASFMAGRSGGSFGCAGFLVAGTPTSLHTCHPQLALRGGLLFPYKEAITMPKLARALLSHLSFAAILLAAYNHAPLIVVLLAVMMLALVHLVGAPK